MSVYTTNTQIVEEYHDRQHRLEGWVANHENIDFASPNVPPSEIIPGSPMSDTFSSKSVPPRLLLRYSDGRPDIPIPNPERDARKKKSSKSSRDATSPMSSESNNHRSHSRTGRSRHGHDEELRTQLPEEIQVFPSQHSSTKPTTRTASHHSHHSSHQSGHHKRSRSLPRDAFSTTPFVPPLPPPMPMLPTTPFYPPDSHIKFSSSQPIPSRHNSLSHVHKPPSMVYAPSTNFHGSYHPPPPIYNYLPNVGADGMVYSHSAPVPPQQPVPHYPPTNATPYPYDDDRRHEHKHKHRHQRSSSGHRHRRRNDSTPSLSPSDDSGSTYYVFPSDKQKVHIVRTDQSSRSPTSPASSKSPTSPQAYGHPQAHMMHPSQGMKKPPLLRRLLGGFATRLSFSSHSQGSQFGPGSAPGLQPQPTPTRRLERRQTSSSAGARSHSEPRR